MFRHPHHMFRLAQQMLRCQVPGIWYIGACYQLHDTTGPGGPYTMYNLQHTHSTIYSSNVIVCVHILWASLQMLWTPNSLSWSLTSISPGLCMDDYDSVCSPWIRPVLVLWPVIIPDPVECHSVPHWESPLALEVLAVHITGLVSYRFVIRLWCITDWAAPATEASWHWHRIIDLTEGLCPYWGPVPHTLPACHVGCCLSPYPPSTELQMMSPTKLLWVLRIPKILHALCNQADHLKAIAT